MGREGVGWEWGQGEVRDESRGKGAMDSVFS